MCGIHIVLNLRYVLYAARRNIIIFTCELPRLFLLIIGYPFDIIIIMTVKRQDESATWKVSAKNQKLYIIL